MNIGISRIKMSDYEQHHYDKEIMKQTATAIGTIEVNPVSDLEAIRVLINKLCDEGPDSPKLSPDWCFIDCKFINWIFMQIITDKSSLDSLYR